MIMLPHKLAFTCLYYALEQSKESHDIRMRRWIDVVEEGRFACFRG